MRTKKKLILSDIWSITRICFGRFFFLLLNVKIDFRCCETEIYNFPSIIFFNRSGWKLSILRFIRSVFERNKKKILPETNNNNRRTFLSNRKTMLIILDTILMWLFEKINKKKIRKFKTFFKYKLDGCHWQKWINVR